MGNGEQVAYWAVIPADIRYDPEVKASAKLLYGELTALCNKEGFCWASNEYFAKLYGLSTATVSRLVSQLEKRGYIRCEMVPTKTGSQRRIYAGMFFVSEKKEGVDENVKRGIDENVKRGVDENVKGGLDENVKQNNTSINNTPYSPPRRDGAPMRKTRCGKNAPSWKPERFASFWAYYPRGENKQAAIRAWDKLRPSDELIDLMAMSLRRQMATEAWSRGIGIPYASTWLNNRRWEDQLKAPPVTPEQPQPLRGEGVTYL